MWNAWWRDDAFAGANQPLDATDAKTNVALEHLETLLL